MADIGNTFKNPMLRSSILLLLGFTLLVGSVRAQTFPLTTNSSYRYLEDQSGNPFFLNGDAAWSLLAQVSYADADLYLTDRAGRGVNAIMVNLIEHSAADHAPNNVYNVAPFTGAVFTTPNELYFAHVDSVLKRANELGIVVLLYPLYLGYQCGVEGWCSEIQAASLSDMRVWGNFVGNRYKYYANIIWVLGGDANPLAYSGNISAKIDTMVSAMQETDNVYSRFFTTHSERQTTAFTHWSGTWLNLNNAYVTHPTTVSLSDVAYSHSPTLPFFLMEGYYEGDQYSSTTQQLRAQAYWAILRGGFGQIFGNCPIWAFGTVSSGCGSDWKSQLKSPGSVSMNYFAKFFKSRNWYKLVPDKNAQVLTSGDSSGTDLAVAAYTTDSSSIIVYVPSQRSVTINPFTLSGDSIQVYWYNPSNDTTEDAGVYLKTVRSYSPPSAGDWVLLLDGKGFHFNPPGNVALSFVSPLDGASGIVTNPALTWNAIKNATSYRVQLSINSSFTSIVLDQSNITSNTLNVNGLTSGTTYFWRVNSTTNSGTTAFSAIWSFTTNSSILAPVLSSPLNGTVGTVTNPTLNWNSSLGAISYRLQVASDAGFGTIILDQSNITSTSLVLNGLSTGTLYYWRLNVSNLQGISPFSVVWNFSTLVATTPSARVMYTDNSLMSPWSDMRSWGVTKTYANTSPVYQGTTSAKIVHSPWASLQFSQGSWSSFVNIDPSPYQSLDFAVNGGTTSFTLKVNCLNASGNSILSPVSFAVPANSWLIKSIPISQLTTVPFTAIQISAAGLNVTFYLDNISLILKPTGPSVPITPNPISPSNNATNQPTSILFRWNSSPGATSYQLQVSTDSSFASTFVNDLTITDTSRLVTGLTNNSNYFWRVLSVNLAGKSSFSSPNKFKTIVALSEMPQLFSPVNNSGTQAIPLTIRWYTALRATGYRIQIAIDSLFSIIILDDSTLVDTTRTVTTFQSFTKYYWRVLAINISGSSPYSVPWSFTTAVAPPGAPLLSLPNDNAVNQPVNLQAAWYRTANATTYHFQLSQDSTFVSVIQDQSSMIDTTIQINSLNNQIKYFWRVNASNAGGVGPYASKRRFTTVAQTPIAPQLVSPINGALNQTIAVTLRWKKSINTTTYRIQLSKDTSFTTIVLDDSTLIDTSKVISSLSYSANYFWRVRATGIGGTSLYSPYWFFTTGSIPSIPVLVAPQNNGVNQPTSLTLQWNSSVKASLYHAQVSTDSMFATTIVNDSLLVDTTRAITVLTNGTTYFWHVRAQNLIGKSSFSPTLKFTTIASVAPSVNYIYQESSLASPWNDIRSWSVMRNYASTTPVYQGSTSARIVHSVWAALQFSQGTWGSFVNISPTPYKSLDFAVHGGTTGVTLKVSCINSSGGSILAPVSITVPANTWQMKSILMSQLATVPFVAINFSAGGAAVTFSLDNIGLVLSQVPIPTTYAEPVHNVYANFSNNGTIDGQAISLFADAWKRNDLSIADIGPAEGTEPDFILKKDGHIDYKDYKVFESLWHWNQTHPDESFAERTNNRDEIGNVGSIEIAKPSTVNSFKNQEFRMLLHNVEESQTVEMVINYNPRNAKIVDISADSTGGRLLFNNIDNISGSAVAAIAATNNMLSKEALSEGLFKIVMTRIVLSNNDSIRVTMRSFSKSSELTVQTTKTFILQKLFVPQYYELFQNYPNPFNPATTIQYSLPSKSAVLLEVYTSLGQSLGKLIDRELDAGFGEVVWNSGNASGIYFYRFVAVSVDNPSQRYSVVKKMLLLK